MPYYTVPPITLLERMMENLEKMARGKRQRKVAEEVKQEFGKLMEYVKNLTDDVNRGEFRKQATAEEPDYPDAEDMQPWGLPYGID